MPDARRKVIRALDLPPLITLGHMAAALLLSRVWSFHLPGQSSAGIFLILLAVVLACAAAITLYLAKTPVLPHRDPTALVTRGPFAFSRNPIYLAMVLALIGWCLYVGQPLATLLALPLYKILDVRHARPEENRLEAEFGDAYRRYAARVPAWL